MRSDATQPEHGEWKDDRASFSALKSLHLETGDPAPVPTTLTSSQEAELAVQDSILRHHAASCFWDIFGR